MTIMLESIVLPETGRVEVQVNHLFEIQVSAAEAQRRVNFWLSDQVSLHMTADAPILVIAEHIVWRVPASIGFPTLGRVGTVGTIEVDVQTGAMNTTPQLKQQIIACAAKLTAGLPPFQPVTAIPSLYMPPDHLRVPHLVITDEDAPLPTVAYL